MELNHAVIDTFYSDGLNVSFYFEEGHEPSLYDPGSEPLFEIVDVYIGSKDVYALLDRDDFEDIYCRLLEIYKGREYGEY